jgi:hypothetical protein
VCSLSNINCPAGLSGVLENFPGADTILVSMVYSVLLQLLLYVLKWLKYALSQLFFWLSHEHEFVILSYHSTTVFEIFLSTLFSLNWFLSRRGSQGIIKTPCCLFLSIYYHFITGYVLAHTMTMIRIFLM